MLIQLDLSAANLWRWLLGLLLFGGLIVWVQQAVGWTALLAPWRDLGVMELSLLLLLTTLSYVLRAVRIYDYCQPILNGAFIATLRLTLLHNALNNFLPMRLGELAFPLLMKRYFDQAYTNSGVTLIWLRLFDLHVLGLAALIFLALARHQCGWLWLIVPWLALIPGLHTGQYVLRRYVAERRGHLARLIAILVTQTPKHGGQLARIWLWTALSWLCKLFAYTAVLQHFSPMDLGRAVLGTLGAELSSILPVHGVAGAGTYEVAMAAVLLPLGIEMSNVLKAAVNLHLYLLGASLLLGLGALLLPRPHEIQAARNTK